ncbi:hypothetical protein EON64_19580, partial [archaeon]
VQEDAGNGYNSNGNSAKGDTVDETSADRGRGPRRLSLLDYLREFVRFRFATIRRRTAFRLRRAEEREHVAAGLLSALQQIDAVIEVIRSQSSSAAVRQALCSSPFSFSERQAEAVLSMTLRRLSSLEEQKLQTELAELREKVTQYRQLMQRDEEVYEMIVSESLQLKDKHALPRKSRILQSSAEDEQRAFSPTALLPPG